MSINQRSGKSCLLATAEKIAVLKKNLSRNIVVFHSLECSTFVSSGNIQPCVLVLVNKQQRALSRLKTSIWVNGQPSLPASWPNCSTNDLVKWSSLAYNSSTSLQLSTRVMEPTHPFSKKTTTLVQQFLMATGQPSATNRPDRSDCNHVLHDSESGTCHQIFFRGMDVRC